MKKTPTSVKRKAAVKKAPSLAVNIAKMRASQPALTAKVDKLRSKIAKLEQAQAKLHQAESQLGDLITNSGFVTDYVDYVMAQENER